MSEKSCMGMCVTASTKVDDLKYAYLYHRKDGIAPPAIVFHDRKTCSTFGERQKENGKS